MRRQLSVALALFPGSSAISTAATAGMASSRVTGSKLIRALPDSGQSPDIDRVEALADAEQEDADDDEGDQDGEGDADLDHQRHALGAGGGKHQPVLQRHEADHLADGIAPRDHHEQAEQHDGEREGEVLARQQIGALGGAQRHHHGQRDQPHAEQHGETDAAHRLDLAMDAEPDDDPMQRHRDQDRLEEERNRRGDVEMRRVLRVGLPGDRQPRARAHAAHRR